MDVTGLNVDHARRPTRRCDVTREEHPLRKKVRRDLSVRQDPTLNSLPCAVLEAARAADATWLPQTVYTDASSHGWTHLAVGCRRLDTASELHVTMLPSRFFEGGASDT